MCTALVLLGGKELIISKSIHGLMDSIKGEIHMS